ncbi:Dxr 1-deoxy-D-xylulose 5-phosphate reductoisomerase [Candidatus Nanopelagicaceae bacterium]
MKRSLVILGSTGSIGVQALEIVDANPELFEVLAISAAGSNPDALIAQAKKYQVKFVGTIKNADVIREALPGVTVIDGANASTEIAAMKCDVVLNAITGSIGLAPTLAAIKAGNQLALANKESLVAGGDLVMPLAKENQILPVDSEHSAIWQCLQGNSPSDVSKLVLTASGGPFRDRADLSGITLVEALAHPTWAMGPVVTINSATLMNKGLEIIEAHHLFNLPYSQIEAVIHPQSIVHSMVEYKDGSTIAQASPPNMKGPISLAINYPHRTAAATAPLDWSKASTWSFAPIDNDRFPAVDLARHCGAVGGALPAIFNAANEVVVDAFMQGRVKFVEIITTVEAILAQYEKSSIPTLRDLSDVSAIEEDARKATSDYLAKVAS